MKTKKAGRALTAEALLTRIVGSGLERQRAVASALALLASAALVIWSATHGPG